MTTPVFVVQRDELDGCWLEAAFVDIELALAYADRLPDTSDVRIERCEPEPAAAWHRSTSWPPTPERKYAHFEHNKFVGHIVRTVAD